MDLHTFFEIIGIIFSVICAIWVYEQYNQRRVNTIWARMDENKTSYYANFVKKEIYENDQKHLKELREEKDLGLMRFFSDKFASLEASILELKTALKENQNDQKKTH